MRTTSRLLVISCAAALAACTDDLGPDALFDAEDAAIVAADTDALTGAMILAQMDGVGSGVNDGIAANSADVREFTRTRACPAGGTVTLTGVAERTVGNGVAEYTVQADGVWDDCSRARGARMLTINGTFSLEAYRRRANGEFSGVQTTTKSGEFTWTRGNGESGTCAFSVTTTRNPETNQRHVEGTVCGRSVNRDLTWRRGDG